MKIKKLVPKVTVKQDDSNPVATEVIAQAILSISDGVKRLLSGPLNEKALVLLIQNAAPRYSSGSLVTARDVKAVLQGIEALEVTYLKAKS